MTKQVSNYEVILFHVQEINTIISNIREYQELISEIQDPSLTIIYEKDIEKETQELSRMCFNLEFLLNNYLKTCKEEDIPIDLNFYRFHKQLKELKEMF